MSASQTQLSQQEGADLGDFERLARVLEARHGEHAERIAEFFSAVHADQDDELRAYAWQRTAEAIRDRSDARLEADEREMQDTSGL